jgi:hypothetical protein
LLFRHLKIDKLAWHIAGPIATSEWGCNSGKVTIGDALFDSYPSWLYIPNQNRSLAADSLQIQPRQE